LIYLTITSLGLGLSLLISGEVYDRIQMPMISALCGIVVVLIALAGVARVDTEQEQNL
jgi:hypothetical protein